MSLRVPVVSVVGKSKSGRTTLLEALIGELCARGRRVAVAKHHAHETDIDVPGKDSWRHARAGAELTMVSAPNRLGTFRAVDRAHTLAELAEMARGADILLTEGFSRESPFRIEVVRAGRSTEPMCAIEDLVAIVTDVPALRGVATPSFGLDEHGGLADLIEARFLRAEGVAEEMPAASGGVTEGSAREGVAEPCPPGEAGAPATRKESSSAVVYLDHAATSWPKPREVVEAVTASLTELGGSPGRGAHEMSLEASRAIFEARSRCAALFRVPDSRDLLFQPGCTAACNLMLNGILEPGDRVVVGSMEHNAVARPMAKLAAMGVEVVVVRADGTGLLDPGDVEKEVRAKRTRAVVCQHASNVTGTIQLLDEISELAAENGALLLVDGAQAAGHLDVNLSGLAPAAYAVAGHKGLMGPPGIGLVYLAPSIDFREHVAGGTGGGRGTMEMPTDRPDRYEAGTLNTPGIVGLGAAAALVRERGAEMRERTSRLAGMLHDGILELGGFEVLGPAAGAPRLPVLTVVHESIDPDRLAFRLDREHSIAARAGLHCAPWAHDTLGTREHGALRLSLGWGSSRQDVDLVLSALARITREA